MGTRCKPHNRANCDSSRCRRAGTSSYNPGSGQWEWTFPADTYSYGPIDSGSSCDSGSSLSSYDSGSSSSSCDSGGSY